MRRLRDIYADFRRASSAAAINLESADQRTIAAFAARKRAAEDDVVRFKLEYHDAVRDCLAGLILVDVSQAKAKRFCDIARSISPLVTVAADTLYRDIATPVSASMAAQGTWPRMMDTAQWNILFATLRDKVDSLGCMTLPSVRAMCYPDTGRHIPAFQTIEEVPRVIKEMIRNANGDEFNRVALGYALADATFQIQESLDADAADAPEVVPAILTGVDLIEVNGLGSLFGKGSLVVTDVPRRDSINKEYVLGKMEALRQIVKNKQ